MALIKQIFMRILRDARRKRTPAAASWFAAAREALEVGDTDRAERHCRDAVAADAAFAPAYHLLGVLCGQRDRLREARAALERALALDSASVAARVDLGHVLRLQGDRAGAARCYGSALSIDPECRLAAVSLGELSLELGDPAAAEHAFRHALDVPADARALKGLVSALEQSDRLGDARAACEAVLTREPRHLEAHASLGYLLLKREHDATAALHHLQMAAELSPGDTEVLANLGIALQDLGRVGEAIEAYEHALRNDPNCMIARFHRSLARLLKGEFEHAWEDYELRLASEDHPRRAFPYPTWDGSDLRGKTILLTAEQGIGDEIMFASCVPELVEQAGHVVIECLDKLAPLYRRSFPRCTVRGGSQLEPVDWLAGLPPIDVTCPVGSLPRFLRPTRSSFSGRGAYLQADFSLCEQYRQRLARLGSGLKIGLSWRGGTAKTRRGMRSVELEHLLPVLTLPGVHFVDLQYDGSTEDVGRLRAAHGVEVHHWTDALDDYDRTAALVGALDLVLSVCTAVVHLGGALGQRVWVMAPFSPEWRYGLTTDAMAWYPKVRVYRQHRPGEWAPLIAHVADELRALR